MAVKFMIFFASRHTDKSLNEPVCHMQLEDHVSKFQDAKEAKKVAEAQNKSIRKFIDPLAPLENKDSGWDVPMEEYATVKYTLRPTKTFMAHKVDTPDRD
jgi:hypothetical protein